MSRFQPDPDALRLGEALAALRRDRGLSQAEAGARLGMTSQGWGLYEVGRRPGLFRPDVQRRLTDALDASPEDLAFARGGLSGASDNASVDTPTADGLEARGRSFEAASPRVRRLQISDDSLAPWAASGVVVEYRPGQWPRQGQGCVLEMVDGSVRVRLYRGADAEALHLAGAGALDVVETIPRRQAALVSAVIARLDG